MPSLFSCFSGKSRKQIVDVLDYSHSNLLYVPKHISCYSASLEELYLQSNQLKDIDKDIFELTNLTTLNVNDNEIISLPSTISNLIHLTSLDISKNGFLDLPDNVKGLKSLKNFDASVNPLGKLPDGFTQLLSLTHVYLNDTFLEFLPANIGRLQHLEVLEVRDNHLSSLPKSMNRLNKLQRLDIGNNEFTVLPEVIGTLVSLEELWLDFNQLSCLPVELGCLKKLQFLDASENRLEIIAEEIGGASALTDLHLTTNLLSHLPDGLCRLKMLQTLKLDDNHISHLPMAIGSLFKLQELIVNGNELEHLPPGLGLMRELMTLNADENYLEALPDELGSCVGLTVLSLRRNRLVHLPDDIGRLANLAVLNVSSNLLENLPCSMIKLKKLKALWLSANQSKPLIPLQTEINEKTNKRYLTCYMFPQQAADSEMDGSVSIDQEQTSFHASLFEDEWKKRTSVLFDLDEDDQQYVRLSRQPTPFPKDIREKIQHFRDAATAKAQTSHSSETHPPHTMNARDKLDAVELQHHHQHAPASYYLGPASSNTTDMPSSAIAQRGCSSLRAEEEMLLKQLEQQGLESDVSFNAPESSDVSRSEINPTIRHSLSPRHVDKEVNSGRPVELSSDSGLGSVELEDEHLSWRNGCPAIPEQNATQMRVVIQKNPILGFSVSSNDNGASSGQQSSTRKGVVVSQVLPNGPANDLLQVGDELLKVNGVDVRTINHEDAVDLLKRSSTVDITFERRSAEKY